MKRLHVVGCPRSGTTLLMEMLSACFHFDGRCAHEMSIFSPPPAGPGLYLSKQPTDVIHLRKVLDRDQDLFVIYLLRDPRAVVTSKHHSTKNYFANYAIWKRCEVAARKFSRHERFLEVRYEDLIERPNLSQRRIRAQFPFLDEIQPFSDFDKCLTVGEDAARAMNGLRPLDRSCLLKWKGHLSRLKEQLECFPAFQNDLEWRGYEPDAAWQALLRGVEPIAYSCRYSQQRNPLKEMERRLRQWFKTRRYLQRLK